MPAVGMTLPIEGKQHGILIKNSGFQTFLLLSLVRKTFYIISSLSSFFPHFPLPLLLSFFFHSYSHISLFSLSSLSFCLSPPPSLSLLSLQQVFTKTILSLCVLILFLSTIYIVSYFYFAIHGSIQESFLAPPEQHQAVLGEGSMQCRGLKPGHRTCKAYALLFEAIYMPVPKLALNSCHHFLWL